MHPPILLSLHSSAEKLALVAAALILAACTAAPLHEDATGPETAKLRLRMEKPVFSNLFVQSIDTRECKLRATLGWLSGGTDETYRKRVGMLDARPPAEGTLEFLIPANVPTAVRTVAHFAKLNAAEILLGTSPVVAQMIRDKQPALCPAPAFMPKAGGQYEIVFKTAPGVCTTTILELKQSPEGITRKDITRDMNLVVLGTGRDDPVCRAP